MNYQCDLPQLAVEVVKTLRQAYFDVQPDARYVTLNGESLISALGLTTQQCLAATFAKGLDEEGLVADLGGGTELYLSTTNA